MSGITFKPIMSNSAYGVLTIVGTFPSGIGSHSYLQSLPIVGGRIPYSAVSVVSGAVPSGMALSIVSNRLQLAGTWPGGAATVYNFGVTLSSDDGQTSPLSSQSVSVAASNVYDSEVMADSPLGYWKLNETFGTVCTDSSGNGFHLQYGSTPDSQGSPLLNGATAFNGDPCAMFAASSKSAAVKTTAPISTAVASITMECMVYLDSWPTTSSYAGAFMKNGHADPAFPSGGSGYSMGVGNGSQDSTGSNIVGLSENVAWLPCSPTKAIPKTGAHLLHMCIESNESITWYLDGGVVGTSSAAAHRTPLNRFQIGCGDRAGRYFTGALSHCAFYGTRLSAARIAAHFAASGL